MTALLPVLVLFAGPLPIVGGDLEPGHAAASALVARRTACRQERVQFVCSAVLVAPRLALTAAHCLDLLGPRGAYELAFGQQIAGDAAEFVPVVEAWPHPDYDPMTHEADVAALVLAAPADVEPASPLARSLDASDVGRQVLAVGYGLTGVTDLGTYGWRRSGTMRISAVEDGVFRSEPDPAMTCEGDSGGPVYVREGDAWRLVGLTVSGDPGCVEEAVNLRLDAVWEDFVEPALVRAAGAGSGWPEDALAPEELCEASCDLAHPCPAGLSCRPDIQGPARCVLPGLLPGEFSRPCRGDDDCGPGGRCVLLWPLDAEPCRCYLACQEVLPPSDGGIPEPDAGPGPPGPGPGWGCAAAGRGSALWALLVILALLRRARWRGRGSGRAG